MLRKNFMKRLSKSASDLSGCKKKTHSTSPEEEEKPIPYTTPSHSDDEEHPRPSSAASSRSLPASKKKSRRKGRNKQPSEVGIRNVGGQIGFKGHQGFLALLKEKFTRSSTPDRNHRQRSDQQAIENQAFGDGGPNNHHSHDNSPNVTPEMVRRQITMDEDSAISIIGGGVPEVIRIRRTSTSEAAATTTNVKKAENESTTTTTTEVIRHGFTEQQQHLCPEAEKSTSCGGVEVVRYQQRPLEVTNNSASEMKSEAVKKKLPPQHQLTFDCPPEPDPDSAPPIRRHPRAFSVVRRRVRSYTNLFQQKDQKSVDGSAQDENESKQPEESLASMESSGSTVAASATNDPRPPSVTSEVTTDLQQNEGGVTKLKPHSLYHLHVCLRNGRELIAKDSSGTSDPYVKFYWRGKQVYKSKTIDKDLNPVWDESFILAIDDPFMPMEIKVYDHDWAFRDDFMGEGKIPLSQLALDKLTEHVVDLEENGRTNEELGQIVLGLRLVPKSSIDHAGGSGYGSENCGSIVSLSNTDRLKAVGSPSTTDLNLVNAGGGSKRIPWSATVNVVLVEGRGLKAMDMEGTSDPYCKVRIGNDRYKSKPIFETLNPKWLEQFDLDLMEGSSQELEISVWDKDQRSKDDFMGRCSVDLSKLEHEKTHSLWVDLVEGTGQLHLLLTISGKTNFDKPVTDLDNCDDDAPDVVEERIRGFKLKHTFQDLNTIGHLKIKIYCAKGLMAADMGGKSDPFVVLELDNTRLQTHTEYKTLTPIWNRILNIPIGDIHSVLHISVYDEDKNHKSEFLGKFAIPLLQIESGSKRWFALRDKKLRERAKGSNPQILLAMTLHWNGARAAWRTLNPKEEIFMQVTEKFKRQIFMNNVMRIKNVIMYFVDMANWVDSCFEWESPVRSIVTFVLYEVSCYYSQPFWVPIILLLIFARNYIVISYLERSKGREIEDEQMNFDVSEEDLKEDKGGEDDQSEEKKTFKEKLQAVQDVTAMVQNALGIVAHLAEGVKNTFNFTVPFLSWLAIVILALVGVILYYVNLRYLLMAWGIKKFSMKLIAPTYVPNNELLDFLSRVPDDEELKDYREMNILDEKPTSPQKSAATSAEKKKKR